MPIEKDVDEKETYWCPKWYWPFAVCTRTVRKHKWCYQFAWVTETGWGLWSTLEGCENGKLYTWSDFSFNFFGTHYYPAGEMCFDSPRSSEGICDASRTGMLASGLSGGKPGFTNFEIETQELSSQVTETGTFEFNEENGGLCRRGLWPWEKRSHQQEISLAVGLQDVTVDWYVGGVPLNSPSGTLVASTSCDYPFPFPSGHSEIRLIQLGYEIVASATKTTLRLRNRAIDGSYALSVGLQAFTNGAYLNSSYTAVQFFGETCDFAPEKAAEADECVRRFRDTKVKFKRPKLGEPVVVLAEEIWARIRSERRAQVEMLVEILNNTLHDDPQTYSQALIQLAQETGSQNVSGWVRIGPAAGKYGGSAKLTRAALGTGFAIGVVALAGAILRGRKKG